MCQLLGMNCNVPTDIVFSFTGFALRGGRTDTHHDGWGIAFFEGAGVRHVRRPHAAIESPVAELIKRYPIKSTQRHRPHPQGDAGPCRAGKLPSLRARAVGPLLGVRPQRRPEGIRIPCSTAPFRPVGNTDSELRVLLPAAGTARALRRHARRRWPTLRAALDELVHGIAAHGTFNMMLSDGSALFAHCSTSAALRGAPVSVPDRQAVRRRRQRRFRRR